MKNVAQFFVIAATAAEPVVGSVPEAGVEDWDVGEEVWVAGVVFPEPLPPLPQAARAIPVAASRAAGARSDSRKSSDCMAPVCRTNGAMDQADSPEFLRRSATPFHGS